MHSSHIAVVGAGSWGTALARLLALGGHPVTMHCFPPEIASGINRNHRNPLYFADTPLPSSLNATSSVPEALDGSPTVYLVVPTIYLRRFIGEHLAAWHSWAANTAFPVLCNCTKGLLLQPTQRTDEWLAQLLPGVPLVHLAGPNFASEIIAGQPAAGVVAGPQAAARRVQRQVMCDSYRAYTGSDPVGVEVAGFYKNILAIAAGAVHGLGLGENARAALITRGLAEMGRLVAYFDGDPATLSGLAGVGDLMLTCGSAKSRNFQVGQRRAAGEPLTQILAEMTQVAEGVTASRAVHLWPAEHHAPGQRRAAGWPELPIAREVYRIVHEEADPRESILTLMRRPPKAE